MSFGKTLQIPNRLLSQILPIRQEPFRADAVVPTPSEPVVRVAISQMAVKLPISQNGQTLLNHKVERMEDTVVHFLGIPDL